MQCLYPVKLAIKADTENLSSRYSYKGRKDWSSYGLYVRCNHCIKCIDERVRIWTYRLMAESRKYSKMAFVTLTYEDGNLPVDRNTTCTKDVQNFFKKIRRYYDYHYKSSDLAYFGALEYGGEKGRIHAHLLILGIDYNDLLPVDKSVVSHNTINCHSRFWKYGLLNYGTDVSLMDSRLIRYVTKYIDKLDSDNLYKFCRLMDMEKPKTFKSVGLGADYLSDSIKNFGELPKLNGLKVSLPPYWQKKFDFSINQADVEKARINDIIQENKRHKIMEGMVDTNENYAHQLEIMRRGVL